MNAKKRRKSTRAKSAAKEWEEHVRRLERATECAMELVLVRAVRDSAQEAIVEIEVGSHPSLQTDLTHIDHTPESWKGSILDGLKHTVEYARSREADILSEVEDAMEDVALYGFTSEVLMPGRACRAGRDPSERYR